MSGQVNVCILQKKTYLLFKVFWFGLCFHIKNRGKNQALVVAIPFCGEYPGPQFEDKFRSANQMDGISKAGIDKMAAS